MATLVLTRTAAQVFDPLTGTNQPRGARMEEVRTWGTELETAIAAAAPSDDPRFTGSLRLASILTCPVITADQNDYAPDLADPAAVFLLSSNAAHNITGINNGPFAGGRILYLNNIGTQSITLVNNSTASTAGYRFRFDANQVLAANQGCTLSYLANRWRRVG